MGGWTRIWIVATAGSIFFATVVSLNTYDVERDGSGSSLCIPGTTSYAHREQLTEIPNPAHGTWVRPETVGEAVDFLDRQTEAEELNGQILPDGSKVDYVAPDALSLIATLTARKTISTYQCTTWLGLGLAWAIALAFSAFVAALAFIVRWVVRGFAK